MKNNPFASVLEKISRKIAIFESSRDLDEFLKEAVSLLMEQVDALLGAVFVYDESAEELIFRVGYDKGDFWDNFRCGDSGAPVRFSLDGNEVGKAFTEGAIRKLNFKSDDHPLKSKILIPIFRGPEKIGVFLMAHSETEAFSRIADANLMQAATLLGDMLAEAMVLINHESENPVEDNFPLPDIISGLKTSEGLAEGTALPIWTDMDSVAEHLPPPGTIEEESAVFEQARSLSLKQLEQMQDSSASGDAEMVSLIFTAQMYMLKDSSFVGKMRKLINEGVSASKSVSDIIAVYADRFSRMSEVRLAEKAQDVRDLGFRLITNMGHHQNRSFSYEGRIVLSRHIYPSDVYRLSVEKVAGLVLQGAGVTAHISILARSLNLPVLISDNKSFLAIPEGTALLLDAGDGKLYIEPDDHVRKAVYISNKKKEHKRNVYTLKGHTADNVAIQVSANVNILKDARAAVRQGAEGIGLYRSEFPFILKNDFLSEEQQYRIYRSIVQSQPGKPVILRTADIGGDKLLQGRSQVESNPFLGVRGIRFSLANREMFRDQLKAMLRAGSGADLGIMLPMVTDVEEVLEAKEEIALCLDQLEKRGVIHNSSPKIGAMVELPSASMSVGELAEETDFLSIGTNDLTMYLLAVDRTNENLSHLYRSHHPTVLRVLATIALESGDKLSQLSVCGDAASDPLLIPFFTGLGIRKLSVSPAKIEGVKEQLSRFTLSEMEAISREMLSIKRLKDMEVYIADFKEKYK